MARRSPILLCVLAACAAGCGREADPRIALCAQVLERRLPRARVVETAADPARGSATLRYEAARGAEAPGSGSLECRIEASGSAGALRVVAATLDGEALPEAELTVINADLLLADLRRADPQRQGSR
jgi:hypothetical protein